MLDANAEIARLRQKLRFKNLPEQIIDEICDEAAREISMTTSDMLTDAMNEAVNAGGDIASVDFIEDIRAVRSGISFDIVTDSGKMDFSEPPFPMLPRLLKNAKVAKDGSLYKVIPIKQKGQSSNRVANTTEAALANIESARMKAKDVRQADDYRGSISPDAMKGMDTVAAMQVLSKQRTGESNTTSSGSVVDFRTASSKQDASTQWVHPGKKADMSGVLSRINANLHDSIDRAIDDVIRKYEGMY